MNITQKVRLALLIGIALLNLYPAIGAISAATLNSLYGVPINTPDLELLMRHRAIMLGLIGGLLLWSAVRPSLQTAATVIGLVSMASFVVLAYLVGDTGDEIQRVVTADIIGSIACLFVLVTGLTNSQAKRTW